MKAFATKFAHNFDETAGHFLGTSSRCSLDFIIAGRWDYFFAALGTTSSLLLGLQPRCYFLVNVFLHLRCLVTSTNESSGTRPLHPPGTRVRPDQRGVPIICCVTPGGDVYAWPCCLQTSLVKSCLVVVWGFFRRCLALIVLIFTRLMHRRWLICGRVALLAWPT
jgi:hypothetical protein